MTLKTILSLILIATLIILSAGCIDNSTPKPEIVYVYVEPTPEPTSIPTPEKIDISVLSIYDRDNNDILNEFELKVAITDYHYKRLTNRQIACLIKILGYVPSEYDVSESTPKPTPTIKPYILPVITPNPDPKDEFVWDNYYNQPSLLPLDISMYEYMKTFSWNEDNQYKVNKFDCSQMAAYTEWELENAGYNVVIRAADVEGEQYGHAWILVEFSDGWLAYECTNCEWVYESENPSYYYAGIQYDSIYNIWNDYKGYSNGKEKFNQEWAWWIE